MKFFIFFNVLISCIQVNASFAPLEEIKKSAESLELEKKQLLALDYELEKYQEAESQKNRGRVLVISGNTALLLGIGADILRETLDNRVQRLFDDVLDARVQFALAERNLDMAEKYTTSLVESDKDYGALFEKLPSSEVLSQNEIKLRLLLRDIDFQVYLPDHIDKIFASFATNPGNVDPLTNLQMQRLQTRLAMAAPFDETLSLEQRIQKLIDISIAMEDGKHQSIASLLGSDLSNLDPSLQKDLKHFQDLADKDLLGHSKTVMQAREAVKDQISGRAAEIENKFQSIHQKYQEARSILHEAFEQVGFGAKKAPMTGVLISDVFFPDISQTSMADAIAVGAKSQTKYRNLQIELARERLSQAIEVKRSSEIEYEAASKKIKPKSAKSKRFAMTTLAGSLGVTTVGTIFLLTLPDQDQIAIEIPEGEDPVEYVADAREKILTRLNEIYEQEQMAQGF